MRRLSAVTLVVFAGCATLQQIGALHSVRFSLDRVADMRLAGVDVQRVRSHRDLTIGDAGRLAAAIAENRLPLSFRLHVRAENPADNTVTARLVRLQWTLLLEDTETISGSLDREYHLPPGAPQDIPIAMELDLLEFFQGNARDLYELALNLAGAGGEPKQISLRAVPSVETPVGSISYPQPVTITGTVGR